MILATQRPSRRRQREHPRQHQPPGLPARADRPGLHRRDRLAGGGQDPAQAARPRAGPARAVGADPGPDGAGHRRDRRRARRRRCRWRRSCSGPGRPRATGRPRPDGEGGGAVGPPAPGRPPSTAFAGEPPPCAARGWSRCPCRSTSTAARRSGHRARPAGRRARAGRAAGAGRRPRGPGAVPGRLEPEPPATCCCTGSAAAAPRPRWPRWRWRWPSTTDPSHVHVYVLDFGAGELAPLAALPHVGAVIGAAEHERQRRLLRRLRGELQVRRGLDPRGPGGRARGSCCCSTATAASPPSTATSAGDALREALARVWADGPELGHPHRDRRRPPRRGSHRAGLAGPAAARLPARRRRRLRPVRARCGGRSRSSPRPRGGRRVAPR